MRDVTLQVLNGGSLAECPPGKPYAGCTSYTVLDVPDDVDGAGVIAQMSKVVIMPLRSQAVPWHAVAGKPQGTIVNLGPKTTAQRVDAHDVRLIDQGGRKLNGIRLTPAAAAALAELEAGGETATAAINRLLTATG